MCQCWGVDMRVISLPLWVPAVHQAMMSPMQWLCTPATNSRLILSNPSPSPPPQVSRHMKSYVVWALSEALSARGFHNQGNLDAAGKHFSLCFIYKWAIRRERLTLIHEASASRLRWITSRSEKLILHLVRRLQHCKITTLKKIKNIK